MDVAQTLVSARAETRLGAPRSELRILAEAAHNLACQILAGACRINIRKGNGCS